MTLFEYLAIAFRVAAGFWAFWSLRETEWTFPAYLLALVGPGLVYFLAATLVPENPVDVQSWRAFYFAIRPRYFAGMACWALVTAVATTVLIGMPWSHPFRLVQLAFVGLRLLGAVFESERLHAGLAAVALALPAMAMLTVLSRPGSLAN